MGALMALRPSTPREVTPGEVSDEELFRRVVAEEDPLAFSQVVERYKRRLMSFLSRMLADRETAEEILQETFLRVYRERGRFRQELSFSTWVFTIAANLAKSELRKRSRWKFLGLETILDRPGREPSPESVMEAKELGMVLENEIGSLPAVFREAFLLRDVEGLSYDEIARVCEAPLGTVKSRVNRARLLLQDALRPYREMKI